MKLTKLSFSLLVVLVLAACQNTQVDIATKVQLPAQFQQQGTAQIELSRWWQSWNDPVLSGLIEQGIQQNYDVQIARSRLNEANAQARLAQADLGPNVSAGGNAGERYSDVTIPTYSGNNIDSHGTQLTGGISAGWELDFFGQKRSDRDAAQFSALSVQEQIHAAQILVAANIAENYLKAKASQQQQANLKQQIAVLQRMKTYVQGRFNSGDATAYELNRISSQLTATQSAQSRLQAEYKQYVRAIAVLTGQTPQTFSLPDSSRNLLANQPQSPSGQTPQGLLERRPDIRAQAMSVQAQAARVASAKADLYPRFTLNFMGQGGHIDIDGDTALKGWASLLSLGINMPIFTNGRIQANIDAADARLKTALLNYDKTLLQALADVDNAYQMQQALVQQNRQLKSAVNSAQKSAADAEKLFRYGSRTLDETLNARLSAIQLQDNLIQSQLAQGSALISIYKALGGGW
ncbi:NodT family efflux transporter outer membrane factor (OMF) lipoprotein [Cricetibacter osteomyelitidis]|uniref:NodT family efflux transporter outer membrane factor (OMF) lipoprotein n=1 Tax=Cricetibacter osteomyelitidis TaxID=1521931 RepID=A0A4R2T5D3_9PAST|nr:TolC family protein [Cricetibacter osteomyelitidis]TCP97275.1 NodT family efflux transporter outer membrane factor (OMF) lipoprotein [Cricetibacter osteomyelitidis]